MLHRFFLSAAPALTALSLAAVLTLSTPAPARANPLDTLDKGPPLGALVGPKVTAPDQDGRLRDFGALKRKRGLILMFSRSFNW